MLQNQTAREMINQLLRLPAYSFGTLASDLGVHQQTLKKLYLCEHYQLLPAKQLRLIKLYCAANKP